MARLIISQRDIACLSFIHAHKVATAKQIHREIFKKDYSNFCKKMRLYEKVKLVNRITGAKDFDLSGVYELTKKGLNVVRANRKGIKHLRYKSNSAYHDLFLVEIRNFLKNRPIVASYLTENQIQTRGDFDAEEGLVDFKRLHCDGLMLIKIKGTGNFLKVAIEFELSDKSMKDYREKLSSYYRSGSIHAVFYVCNDRTTEARIKKSELDVCKNNKNKIYYLTYDQLQNTDHLVTFCSQNGSTIQV